MSTTIKLEDSTKKELEKEKTHPRETYDSVIKRLLILTTENDQELSDKTIRNIESSLEDIKKGRVSSHDTVKKRLGLK